MGSVGVFLLVQKYNTATNAAMIANAIIKYPFGMGCSQKRSGL